ncbi:UPF0691 protein C9orf116 homolog [Geodia barretti]|nr:UPF0691 protein C9orf116 homolog [Geodia barretti]
MITSPGTLEDMTRPQHPMYVTTSNAYGQMKPSVQSVPTSFHGRVQKFSEHLSHSGMYRNHSLNTARDHTRV